MWCAKCISVARAREAGTVGAFNRFAVVVSYPSRQSNSEMGHLLLLVSRLQSWLLVLHPNAALPSRAVLLCPIMLQLSTFLVHWQGFYTGALVLPCVNALLFCPSALQSCLVQGQGINQGISRLPLRAGCSLMKGRKAIMEGGGGHGALGIRQAGARGADAPPVGQHHWRWAPHPTGFLQRSDTRCSHEIDRTDREGRPSC